MEASLAATRAQGGMAELEEYVGEWQLRVDGTLVTESEYTLLDGDHAYPAFDAHRCTDIPRWELHLGFDLPKAHHANDPPPIALGDLGVASTEVGLDNGGWFIFANDQHCDYRSNEFADGSEADARQRLFAQARALHGLLAERGLACDVGFSLERVHGMWTW